MAITTDSYKTVTYNGVEVGKIGISKKLSVISDSELWEYVYCTSMWDWCNNFHERITDNYFGYTNDRYTTPFNTFNDTSKEYNLKFTAGTAEPNNPEGIYARIVWMYKQGSRLCKSAVKGEDEYRLVTEMPANKMRLKLTLYNAHGGSTSDTWETFNSPHQVTITSQMKYQPTPSDVPVWIDTPTLHPHIMFKYNDKLYVYKLMYWIGDRNEVSLSFNSTNQYANNGTSQCSPYNASQTSGTADLCICLNLDNGEFTSNLEKLPYTVRSSNFSWTTIMKTPFEDVAGVMGTYDHDNGGVYYCATNLDACLKFIANYGMNFYADKDYKVIIEGGYVTGYTDNLSAKSDIDDYTGSNTHEFPIVPPTPKPSDGDDVDDMPLGFEGYENGFIKHYQVTSGNLETISQKIAEDTEHLNAIDSIVSLKSYVIPTNYFIASSTSDRITISGIDTTVDAPKITVTKSDYEIGSTTVSGKYGSASNPHFLDFAPYTQLECYIPFCGVVQLPDWVMYKTIHVILVSDIITGSCKGIVKCNGDIVAEKVGVLGIDAPFTSEANALKNSAMLQTVLNGANIGMQTLGSGLIGSYTGITKGALQGIANIQQSIIAGNNNYTVSVGSSPDRIEYAMPSACYIKKYFPVKEEPDNYLHTIGKPLMKKKTIYEVSGYTVCSNVDTSSITCTEQEREMIKNILESGVYL